MIPRSPKANILSILRLLCSTTPKSSPIELFIYFYLLFYRSLSLTRLYTLLPFKSQVSIRKWIHTLYSCRQHILRTYYKENNRTHCCYILSPEGMEYAHNLLIMHDKLSATHTEEKTPPPPSQQQGRQ